MKTTILLILLTSLSSCSILNIFDKKSSDTSSKKNGPIGQTADDLRISAGIHVDLFCLDLFKPVDVKVKDGIVYYTGSVPSLKLSYAASGIAWKQNGVKKVVNNLKVDDKLSSPFSANQSSNKNAKN